MPLVQRKRAVGGAPATTLSADISASALVFTVPASGGTGYPDGSNGQFIITFERTTSKEEKALCDSRAGDTFTIAAGGRGYDDTTAQAHTTGATVNHTIGAVVQNELYDFLTLPDAAGEIPFATAADNWGKKGFGTDLIMSGTLAARPAFGTAGRLYFATDDAGGTLYRDSGAAWVKVAGADLAALSGDVATAQIENDAVTYPKMQNVSAASRLLGRGSAAGAGDPEEITLGAGLSMAGTALSATTLTVEGEIIETLQTTTSTAYTNLTTVGPSVTVTVGASGKLLVMLRAQLSNNTVGESSAMGFQTGANPAGDARALILHAVVAGQRIQMGLTTLVTGLSAVSTTLTAKYRATAGTGTFSNRELIVMVL